VSGEQVSLFSLATRHSSLSTSTQLRGLESNQRPPGSGPGVTTSSDCPGIRGEGVEPSSPGSRPGSLPLADPRESGRRGNRGLRRTLKAHRSAVSSAVFGTAAIACWLALPFQTAAYFSADFDFLLLPFHFLLRPEGLEPPPYRLKGGYAAITPRPPGRVGRSGFSG
jgi:hypothetical protein